MEKLYNNIILPDDFASREADARNVPYLKKPPEVINISVGRQLFVDDFLIQESDLTPVYHDAVKYEGNPVLKPETEWELYGGHPAACPKSGGVWYDEKEKIYKMWYEAGWIGQLAYAVSHDGIEWERPDLGDGTNRILHFSAEKSSKEADPSRYFLPDSTTFIIDDDDPDTSRRYKMFLRNPGGGYPGIIGSSPDGIHWENFCMTTDVGDRSTIFYNPFRKKWVYSIRSISGERRRYYRECVDLFEGREWDQSKMPRHWLDTDELDLPDPYIMMKPQLYNVDAVGYESIMLGMFQIFHGPENGFCADRGVPKITELIPMYSRDGYNFSRPSRRSFIEASMHRGAWDRGYIQSVGGGTVIHGDELWIYYIGFAGDERFGGWVSDDDMMKTGMYMNGATGIAKLRRDGFVSLEGKGRVTTRAVEIGADKRSLHLNAVGKVRVTLLSEDFRELASADFCGDSTNARLCFGDFDIRSLGKRSFRIRFEVDGALYSFGFADEKGDFGGAHGAGIAL